MEDLLKDENTYMIVKKNPVQLIEKNLNNLLKKWVQKEYISKCDFHLLRTSDSLLPKTYGLPKIHKENYPLRIIVSSALHVLATYLLS